MKNGFTSLLGQTADCHASVPHDLQTFLWKRLVFLCFVTQLFTSALLNEARLKSDFWVNFHGLAIECWRLTLARLLAVTKLLYVRFKKQFFYFLSLSLQLVSWRRPPLVSTNSRFAKRESRRKWDWRTNTEPPTSNRPCGDRYICWKSMHAFWANVENLSFQGRESSTLLE